MSELKYVIFFGVLILGVPVGYFIALRRPFVEKIIFFLALFFTSRLAETINFVSHEQYRGTSRGFEVTLVDLAALVLFLLVLARREQYPIKLLPPGSLLYGCYFLFSAMSLANAGETIYSLFELWKMVRMYFYFWVFYNYINSYDDLKQIVNFIGYIIIYIFLVVMYQKYRLGLYQTNGPFPHQNSLVMYLIIFNSIIFAKLLEEEATLKQSLYTCLLLGIGSICIVSTLSRAGLFCFGVSLGMILVISFAHQFKAKKLAISLLLALMGLVVVLKSVDSIIRRFETAPEESKLSRIALGKGAIRMANDKFLGVGLNNFGLKINAPYPYGDHIERPTEDFKEGLVETTYLMIAAETGWLNLMVFLCWIFSFYFRNIYNFFLYKGSLYRFLPIALLGGLTGIYLESTLEWVLKQTNNFYQLMLVFAIIACMTKLKKGEAEEEEEDAAADTA